MRCARPSPSARRAWIEIKSLYLIKIPPGVALRTEGVDRNRHIPTSFLRLFVALRTEGVDRNSPDNTGQTHPARSPSARRAWIEIKRLPVVGPLRMVALRTEGVDRNRSGSYRHRPGCVALRTEGVDRNPCSQRAVSSAAVALRTEGVDRNLRVLLGKCVPKWSPSARRAWIEIRRSG